MELTEVRVKKLNTDNRLKGIASITLDDSFVVRGIKIVESQRGLFVAMPSEKGADGIFRDIVHPVNIECRERIQSAILEKFNEIEEEEDGE
jgi:stage V sporulation protein G